MGGGEGHQQDADGQHQPGFIGVPEGADGGDHPVFFRRIREGKERANAKVESVKDNVDQDGDAHQGGKGEGQPDFRVTEEGHHGAGFQCSWVACSAPHGGCPGL